MNRIQAIENSILLRLRKIFEENNIEYWLAYGTALGSVRHKGFIPWDDDVDIYIDGSVYSMLKKAFEERGNDYYGLSLHDFTTVPDYPFTFPKVVDNKSVLIENRFNHLDYKCGIYIDIFLLFPVSNNALVRHIGYKRRYFLYTIVEANYCKLNEQSFLKRFIGRLQRIRNPIKAQKKLYSYYQKKWTGKELFLCEPLQFSDKTKHRSICFRNHDVGEFEKNIFNVPFRCSEYLTDIYGDYMKLPPVEKRISPHSFVVFKYGDENE